MKLDRQSTHVQHKQYAKEFQENRSCFCYFRSCHGRCSVKKVVLRNFVKFTGKHLCQSLFFNKVAALRLQHLFYTTPVGDCFCYLVHVIKVGHPLDTGRELNEHMTSRAFSECRSSHWRCSVKKVFLEIS